MAKSVVDKKTVTTDLQAPAPIGDEHLSTLTAQKFSYDPYAGYSINDKPILPVFADEGERSVQKQIDTGRSIDTTDGIITYGFFDANHAVGVNNNPHYGEGRGYTPFTEEQKAAAAASIQLWDDLIAPTFVNKGDISVSEWAHGDADILFSNTTTGPAQAWAYYPGDGKGAGGRVSSDVWINNPEVQADNGWFGYGEYGATTLTHEIGHTLGFSHPGTYNGSAATTYDAQAEYAQDSTQYSIMSYWSPSETGAVMYDFQNSGGLFDLPSQTPLVHDIALIQAKYGADLTTRTGDTTYGFNSDAGNGVYDFTQNILPHLSIYDAGGDNDTIDLSGYTMSQVVDLNPGAFSSIGQTDKTFAQMGSDLHQVYLDLFGVDLLALKNADGTPKYTEASLAGLSEGWFNGSVSYSEQSHYLDTGYDGLYTIAYDNVSIAYGTIIENAIGGQNRDLLRGNDVANHLDGQGGDDILIGGLGADTLTGGEGHDLFVFDHLELGDVITDFGADDMIDLSALGDNLSYIGNSAFSGTAGEVSYVDGVLALDANGDMHADFGVSLAGLPTLVPDQLVLVA